VSDDERSKSAEDVYKLIDIISGGAHDFLYEEYRVMVRICLFFYGTISPITAPYNKWSLIRPECLFETAIIICPP